MQTDLCSHRVDRRTALATVVAGATLVLGGGAPAGEHQTAASEPRLAGNVAGPLVFTHVNVVDVAAGRIDRDRTVIIADDRIAAIGGADLPVSERARVIDGRDRFLMAGLWDTHVHTLLPGMADFTFPFFLAHGVTSVRDMAGDPALRQTLATEIADGERHGPRVLSPGPWLDGPHPLFPEGAIPVSTAEDAVSAVAAVKRMGADHLSLYFLLPREAALAAISEGKHLGLPAFSQGIYALSLEEAAHAGMAGFETLTDLVLAANRDEAKLRAQLSNEARRFKPTHPNPLGLFFADDVATRVTMPNPPSLLIDGYDRERAKRMCGILAKTGTAISPQLLLLEDLATVNSLNDDHRLSQIPEPVKTQWRAAYPPSVSKSEVDTAQRLFDLGLELVGLARDAGVPIVAGTHTVLPYVIPGADLHVELKLLVDAGLSQAQALSAATITAAELAGLDDQIGELRTGMIADLLLLDADPLIDIRNSSRIALLVQGGKLAGST